MSNNNVKNLKKKMHPTQSFAQMMSQAQLKALQPYIQQLVAQQFQQATQGIYQFVMNERAQMQTRQLAFEKLLKQNCSWFSDELLALTVAEVEDEASGMEPTDETAKKGDKVRLELWAKKDTSDGWDVNPGSKLAIHSLGTVGPNGKVQTHADLEEAVVGLRTGDSKEFLLAGETTEDGKVDSTKIKVTIMRISREKTPPTPASVPAEATTETSANA